jgi:hypothetical protein
MSTFRSWSSKWFLFVVLVLFVCVCLFLSCTLQFIIHNNTRARSSIIIHYRINVNKKIPAVKFAFAYQNPKFNSKQETREGGKIKGQIRNPN